MEDNKKLCDIEQHAVLFGLLAREAITLCPETGLEAVRAGVREYGRQRGGRMARRCQDNGDPLSPVNYQAYNERSSRPGQMRSLPAVKLPEYTVHVEKCAWVDAWRKYDLLEYGKYYCLDIDKSLTQGFSGDRYEVQIGGWLSWGDDYCDMRWGFPMDEKAEKYIAEKRASLGDGAIRDYDFHTGDMFSVMASQLAERLGEDGKKAAIQALEQFSALFTPDYIRAFWRACPLSPAAQAAVDAVLKS